MEHSEAERRLARGLSSGDWSCLADMIRQPDEKHLTMPGSALDLLFTHLEARGLANCKADATLPPSVHLWRLSDAGIEHIQRIMAAHRAEMPAPVSTKSSAKPYLRAYFITYLALMPVWLVTSVVMIYFGMAHVDTGLPFTLLVSLAAGAVAAQAALFVTTGRRGSFFEAHIDQLSYLGIHYRRVAATCGWFSVGATALVEAGWSLWHTGTLSTDPVGFVINGVFIGLGTKIITKFLIDAHLRSRSRASRAVSKPVPARARL